MTDINKLLQDFVATIEDDELRQRASVRLKRNSHVVTGAILVDDAGKICLIQELKKTAYMKWNTPMGHWDYGENMTDAAKREVKEETGYDIEITKLLPLENIYDNSVFRIVYIGKIIGGSPEERDESEINAVEWFTLSEIEHMRDNGELRDGCCWQDVELYMEGQTIPLDTIRDVESGDSYFDKGGAK
ncbi:MAG: NUDIX domain-containing protein [Candidatus Saccharimonadales bacterium]